MEQILEKEGKRYLPLLQYTIKKSNPDFAPPGDTDERIRTLRLGILARNAFLFNELKKLLNACGEAGIKTILLKGAMMEGIYPAGLRPFTDIDFLIRREKLSQVAEILDSLGYRFRGRKLRRGEEDFHCEVEYMKRGSTTIFVEPHWLLGPPYSYAGGVGIEGLWRRAKKASVAGVDALILSPEDSLLHFCIHFFKHRYGGWLASSCDIAEMVRHYGGELDWQAFLSRVFEFRLCLPVRYSLQRTVQLFHLPVPGFVLSELGLYRPARVEQLFFALLTRPGDGGSLDGELLAELASAPGLKLKLRRFLDLLFPSGKFMLSYYAIARHGLLPFYYLLHWKNAFVMALKALFTIARNMPGVCRSKQLT